MVWGDWFWEVPGENQSKQGKVCYADLGCSLPIDKSFYRLSLLLFLVQRGGSLTNGIGALMIKEEETRTLSLHHVRIQLEGVCL